MTLPLFAEISWIGAWQTRIVEASRRLGKRPWALVAVYWAINAVALPYAGFSHDARLYGLQVLNRMSGGAFADDLFLRFGSQDQYTPFSRLAAPLANALGLENFFFGCFILANGLLVVATVRLTRALVDDDTLSTMALLFMATFSFPYGGLLIFNVYEPFFTPRILSCALALFALERVVRRRYVTAFFIGAAAAVMHPLMGFGAVAITAGCVLFDAMPRRFVVPAIGAALVCGVAVLGIRALGVRLFGTMDATWYDLVRRAAPLNFPALWTFDDWTNAIVSIAIPVVAAAMMFDGSPARARFLLVSAALGAVGLATMSVASGVPYRLLLQGQPYRALWILRVIEIPLTLVIARRLWRIGQIGPVIAVLLVGFFGIQTPASGQLGLFVAGFLAFALLHHTSASRTPRQDWLARSVAGGLVTAFFVWGALRVGVVLSRSHDLLQIFDPVSYERLLVSSAGPVVLITLVLGAVGLVSAGSRARGPAIACAALAVVASVQGTAFAMPHVPLYRDRYAPYAADLRFVTQYMDSRNRTAADETLYEGIWENLKLVWLDLQEKSYFNLVQMSGVLFSRQTALEAQRRADVVRPFELERYHVVENYLPSADKLMVEGVFDGTTSPKPSATDLLRLCDVDEHVDVAILKHDFGGLASASNGRVYIYECARVRVAEDALLRNEQVDGR